VFDLGVLRVGDNDFVLRAPAPFSVAVTNAGAGIVAHGSIAADVTGVCARCLCEFPLRIEGEVVGFYLEQGSEPPEAEETDQVDRVDSDGSIDLSPALLAALVVEAPFAPLHDDECKGLCTSCGEDLNLGPCGCENEPSDEHPFAGLKDLLTDESAESE
jgi:uncharacterized protein